MTSKKSSSSSSGGIFNSGIFGFVGTTIQCDANDGSVYCNVMKFFNLFMVIIFVSYILYLIYYYLSQRRRR
jgi:ABC-type multidrug transport system permease subunit